MAKYIEDEVHIESPMDLEAELCKYNCKTEKELDELLWYDMELHLYQIIKIKKRITYEHSL